MRPASKSADGTRRPSRPWRWLGALILLQFAVGPAFAQMGGGAGGMGQPGVTHMRGGGGGSGNRPATPNAPPPIKVQPDAWPRLDPGAMLCSTDDALKQYQEAMANASPDTPPVLPKGCERVLQQVPISIVQRDGPSRSLVKSSGPPERTGWTDAWLPARLP